MSSSARYGKDVTPPPGTAELLKGFTREVLRHQPPNDDFFAFGLDYFDQLLAEEDRKGGIGYLPADELKQLLDGLFVEADTDGSGSLSLTEFKTVLKRADLGLSDKDARVLFSEVDMDESGEIGYEEFIPLAVDMIQSMYARMDAVADEAQRTAAAEEQAQEFLHGMSREEVGAIMADIFKRADADGSGALTLAEFQRALKEADIGLTKKEMRILMVECDVDQDGTISYEEFIPVAFDILVEIVKSQVLGQRSTSDLEEYLLAVWQGADGDGAGCLPPSVLSQSLRYADLGLTRIQVHSVIGEADVDDDGQVTFERFVPKAASMIVRLLDYSAQVQRAQAVQMLDEKSRAPVGLEDSMAAAFQTYDQEGSGWVSIDTVIQVLTGDELGLQLSQTELNALLSTLALHPEDPDYTYYPDLCAIAAQVLQYLADNLAIDY